MKTVGIDIGHCETVGTVVIESRAYNKGIPDICHVNIQNNERAILTQVVLTDEQMRRLKGKTSPTKSEIEKIGEIAFGNALPSFVPDGEKFMYFKVPPKDFDEVCAKTEVGKECGITYGMVMACFANALIKSMFSHNPGLLKVGDVEEAELFIGCPATEDWTAEDAREKYAELIERATGVKRVEIIPESRAVVFGAAGSMGRGFNISHGAALFDFGSSKASFTYMQTGRRLIEFTWRLGASAIEREIVAEALAEAQEKRSFEADDSSFAWCENDLRRAKEGYYNGQYGVEGHDRVCVFKTKEQKPVKQPITVDEKMMNRVVNERKINIIRDSNQVKSGSWYELCREFFETARDALEKEGLPIETIVLTGGASRMGFIYELCREVFEGLNILLDMQPSYTVADGLGWIARYESNAEECMRGAREEMERLSTIEASIGDSIYDLVYDILMENTEAWAQLPDKHAAMELFEAVKAELQHEKSEPRIEESIYEGAMAWAVNLSEKIGEAVNNQIGNLYSDEMTQRFMLDENVWAEMNRQSFDEFYFENTGNIFEEDVPKLFYKIMQIVYEMIVWDVTNIMVKKAEFMTDLSPIEDMWLEDVIAWMTDAVGYEPANYDDYLSYYNELVMKVRERKEREQLANETAKRLSRNKVILSTLAAHKLEPEFEEYRKGRIRRIYDAIIDSMLENAFEIVTLKRFDNAESGV